MNLTKNLMPAFGTWQFLILCPSDTFQLASNNIEPFTFMDLLFPPLATYHFRITIEGRQIEGRASVFVCVVGGGSALHQAADDR